MWTRTWTSCWSFFSEDWEHGQAIFSREIQCYQRLELSFARKKLGETISHTTFWRQGWQFTNWQERIGWWLWCGWMSFKQKQWHVHFRWVSDDDNLHICIFWKQICQQFQTCNHLFTKTAQTMVEQFKNSKILVLLYHINNTWSTMSHVAVREFTKTLCRQICQFKIDVNTGGAKEAAFTYYKINKFQNLHNSSVSVTFDEM